MKRRSSVWYLVLCTALVVAMLTGCGASSNKYASEDVAVTEEWYAPEMDAADGMGGSALGDVDYEAGSVEESKSESANEGKVNPVSKEKLIWTVDLSVETKTYDDMLTALYEQIEEYEGYVESRSSYNGSIYDSSSYRRHMDMVIRIPADRLTDFLNEVSTISNVVHRNEASKNVTLAYVDLQSRKEALLIEEERLLELLEIADTVADIITIEERLSEVRYQIESMESSLRTYDNKINYSTINLSVEEVRELTPVKEETIWERITGGFAESLRDVGDGFVEVFVWIIVNSPILLVWAVIIILGILVIRASEKKRRARNAARKVQKTQKNAATNAADVAGKSATSISSATGADYTSVTDKQEK